MKITGTKIWYEMDKHEMHNCIQRILWMKMT